ncbi:YcnI family protein [Agrococcus lahaulensis]|uniref:YcnI family protein n=1 Tax=Agrococcus lahaulensis TaxID=341722 RepID=UPI0006868373|nr:YcnI family protein [Agrococcus lahaulensis]
MTTSTDPARRRIRAVRRIRPLPALTGTVIAAALVLAAPVAASAHVHAEPTSTEPGARADIAFAIGHGCDGSPTTAVEIEVPAEIAAVGLIANPGWDVAIDTADGTRTVVFTAEEPLPDGVRDTLELSATLPDDAEDGTVLAFPTRQLCEVGESAWTDLDQSSDTPAPIVTIGGGDGHGHGPEAGHDAAAGDAPAASDATAAMPIAIVALVVALAAAALAAFAAFRRRA